ncbi:MAG TPA: hypothetical protein VFT66_15655 [Roseiflexaceae bacterium]|nr:hypothetical protein [Roseiflexaceae bacterium]
MTAYATRADLYQYLQQLSSAADTPDDGLVDAILDRATSIIDGALGFHFAGYAGSASAQQIVSYGAPVLDLPPHQAGSVASVAYGGSVIDRAAWRETEAGALAIVDPTTWQWFPRHSVWDVARWQHGLYAVTAAWGYGAPPASIVQVCLELSVNIWRAKDKGMFTDTIGVDGSGGVRYIGGLTNLQQQIIRNERARIIGIVV